MAHISDGVLAAPVLIGGGVMSLGLLAYGLRRLDPEKLPQVALMSAAFFVASLIHIPLGPSSVHLLLNGLVGMVLGWAAVPAIFVAVLLQALFFGFGGITALGVNVAIMAVPAVLAYAFFARQARCASPIVWGAMAGAFAVAATCAAVALALAASGAAFLPAAKLIAIAHVPVMVVEAVLTGTIVAFLRRVRPAVLDLSIATVRAGET
jgi:cobalt/nickel transport system permease protein